MQKMKHVVLLFLICGLVYKCKFEEPVNPNALTEPLTVENEEVGWKIEVPAGWEVASEDESKETNKRGIEKIEEAMDSDYDTSEWFSLLSITKNETNILAISAEPFFEEYINEWEVNNEFLREILLITYADQGMTAEFSPVIDVDINGVEFNTYSISISKLGDSKTIKQRVYSTLHNGYDLSASITYADDEIKDEMISIWKTSEFEIKQMPDSLIEHYAKMEKTYTAHVARGDQAFEQSKFGEATFWYTKAYELNPLDEYPISQLNVCEDLWNESSEKEMEAVELEWQFQQIVDKADELFETRYIMDSYDYYQRALTIKPNDTYVKNKLLENKRLIQMDWPDWTPE